MHVNETKKAIEVMQDFIENGVTQCQQAGNSDWVDTLCPSWNFQQFNYRKKYVPETGYMTDYKDNWGKPFPDKESAINALDTDREGARIIKWIEVLDDEI